MPSNVRTNEEGEEVSLMGSGLILKLIQKKAKPGLWLTGWRQAPLSEEALTDAKRMESE